MTDQPTNKGLQVAGAHGADTTINRYGRDFWLQKMREKGYTPKATIQELHKEADEFFDNELGPAIAAPTKPNMRTILGPGGVIAQSLPGYEPREPQLQMAELVATAIEKKAHAIVEAGTGTGKSLAYLIPAIYSGKRTIVSTADKGLQDQLWKKDIPFLRSVLPVEFVAAIVKGKSNYLCTQKYNEEMGDQMLTGETHEFAQVRIWLETSESGDIEELPFALSPELASKVTCTTDACPGKHCQSYESCYAEKAKRKAEVAQIIIVNHTLLTLDVAIRNKSDGYAKVIPDRNLVIVDEAHRLEDAATLAFQTEVSAGGINRLLNDKHVKAAGIDSDELARIEVAAQMFFDGLGKISNQQTFTIDGAPQTLKTQAGELSTKLRTLAKQLECKNPHLAQDGSEEGNQAQVYKKFVDRIKAYSETVYDILDAGEGEIVYVAKSTFRDRQRVMLRKCPICVADDLREALFEEWPAICTSATISTNGNMDYFKSRVGCDDAEALIVESPFDYQKNALIYMPPAGQLFDPTKYYQDGSPEYFDRLGNEIERLLLASDGRAFCLFTSRKALNEVYERIANRLRWTVLKQGDMPRPEIIKRFKEDGHAVLFGLKSFWEGVDVQGEALSLVVIDKIPFGQPDDPIYDARCKEIVARTKQQWAWFNQLALPNAIITYKQGFGRLIRTRNDFGVVALLDGRITTKNYGGSILRSLPRAMQTRSIEAVELFFRGKGVCE